MGNGNECVDINECVEGTDNCDDPNAHCVNQDGFFGCSCNDGYDAVAGVCTDRDECLNDADNECSVNADCTNTAGGYECTCPGEYEGDGKDCLLCPSDECWTYDSTTKSCTIKADSDCTSVECGATSMSITFKSGLFGIEDDMEQNWASEAKPSWFNGSYVLTADFGEYGMTHGLVGNELVMKMLVALSGNARQRSDFGAVTARKIDLGSKSLYSTPFGVGVLYRCTYPVTVTVESDNFEVRGVDMVHTTSGTGNLAAGFSMVLNDNLGMEFILGAMLKVGLSWSVDLDQLTFFISDCYVSHGSKNVNVVKEGCFADALESTDLSHTKLESSFEYKLFKGVGENSASQSITCTATICNLGECSKPTEVEKCPAEGDDVLYQFLPGLPRSQ